MASVITWFQTNWLQIVAILLVIDRLLVQLFPSNTLFQGILNFLQGIGGTSTPAAPANIVKTTELKK